VFPRLAGQGKLQTVNQGPSSHQAFEPKEDCPVCAVAVLTF
jgi:hypothetical protein